MVLSSSVKPYLVLPKELAASSQRAFNRIKRSSFRESVIVNTHRSVAMLRVKITALIQGCRKQLLIGQADLYCITNLLVAMLRIGFLVIDQSLRNFKQLPA